MCTSTANAGNRTSGKVSRKSEPHDFQPFQGLFIAPIVNTPGQDTRVLVGEPMRRPSIDLFQLHVELQSVLRREQESAIYVQSARLQIL
jgi:hypothetical protein